MHRMSRAVARGAAALAVAAVVMSGWGDRGVSAQRLRSGGDGMLVGIEALKDPPGAVCAWPTDWQVNELRAERAAAGRVEQQGRRGRSAVAPGGDLIGGDPIRAVRDPNAAFAAVAVDVARNEVIATDENLFQILAFDRTGNTPPGIPRTMPKRTIAGEKTQIEFQSGVYVDPETGDIYATNNDTRNKLAVFAHGGDGNVAPVRLLDTPHGAFGITVDNAHQEMLITIQHDSAVVTYRKQADGKESPTRLLQGNKTGVADPHGIVVDPRDDLIFVANYGSTHDTSATIEKRTGVPSGGLDAGKSNWPLGREYAIPGSGTTNAPSIVVHKRTDSGNASALRVIQGPATQLDWPTGLAFDAERRELYVANDAGASVLVFDANANGNVAPKRVLKGARTNLANPTSVFVDAKNKELWVANFGGHSITVYPIDAKGDVAPRRIIRSAPPEAPSLMIGNPGAVAYDTKREEILVPNCVAHPQIAVFACLADGDARRVRAIEGQKTQLGRTMHAIAYDAIHDEIFVPQQFGQGILVFEGNATGEIAPKRVIQGPDTQLIALDRLAVDPVNNEIYVPEGRKVLVFPRDGNGNVKPTRVIEGPDTTMLAARAVAVDPSRNLIVVSATPAGGDPGDERSTELAIFDRTATGNAKPLRVITGVASTQNIAVFEESGLIFGVGSSFVAVWRIDDNGKVAPRYTIGGPNGKLVDPRGVTIDRKNKTVIISDKYLNAVLTYSVPQLFDAKTSASASKQDR